MLKSNKLCLTSSGTEPRWQSENAVLVHVLHDIAYYDVLRHLTVNTG